MIIADFLGESPVKVSQATRTPFQRPAEARGSFIPRSPTTGFIPEFGPFPAVMPPTMVQSLPVGVHNPLRSDPGSNQPIAADPSGQSSLPAGVPAPVKVRSGRLMPPGLIMALGIMPPIRGVRAGRVNPAALVAAGRVPSAVG